MIARLLARRDPILVRIVAILEEEELNLRANSRYLRSKAPRRLIGPP
jgi:hypothetical protein